MFESASRAELQRMAEMGKRAVTAAKNMRDKAEQGIEVATETMLIQGVAFGFAFARGWFGTQGKPFELVGVPPDLLGGLLLHGAGFLGGFGKNARLAHAAGNGALSCFTVAKGIQFGVESFHKSKGTAPAKTSGELNPGGMSDRDLAEVIRQTAAAA